MKKANRLIVFIVPQKKVVNGGVMSIFSQCKEARKFYDIHKAEAIVCTYPGFGTYGKNDLFENDERVYSFDEVISDWPHLKELILHIPECGIVLVNEALQRKYHDYIQNIPEVSINVMTQNIDLLPSPAEFAELFTITPRITQTTAHSRYATQELSDTFQTPVHHLSVYVDGSQYKALSFAEKENLIIYSPDNHPKKEAILTSLASLDGFKLKEIKGLTFREYKDVTANAKFCITFGEGFDGYFVESFLSGSIGFAVYNERFFPNKAFASLPSVFDNYASMEKNLVKTILQLNEAALFSKWSSEGAAKIEELYKYEIYIKKMKAFYDKKYDFTPRNDNTHKMLVDLVVTSRKEAQTYNSNLTNKDEEVANLEQQLATSKQENQKLRATLQGVLTSHSWKITKPLRALNSLKNKRPNQ